ncbi:MAG: alpha/beta hydrolase [Bryobacteraceae bacterium]|nr:alpha/beta hydrolase [Bryobacteraceae bacterium]
MAKLHRITFTRLRRFAPALYLLALLGSYAVTAFQPRAVPPSGTRFAELAGGVRIAYRTFGSPERGVPPVVLVHGSPGAGNVMYKLATLLAPRFHVIVPDLPGFGHSTRRIRDYSFRAHSGHLLALLDALGIERAHLVGFSMGGGVILSAAETAPSRTASLVLLSAIGVQEHELTGNYHANRTLHALQLAILAFAHHGFPHFGLFTNGLLSVEYARNFYDSDQRPLRAIIQQYNGPLLIIHGRHDVNVPVAAAREHHRLVRHSRLIELDNNHFMAFLDPEIFLAQISDFLAAPGDGSPQPR